MKNLFLETVKRFTFSLFDTQITRRKMRIVINLTLIPEPRNYNSYMKKTLVLLTALGICAAAQLHAATIDIKNFGFENGTGFNVATDGFPTTSSFQGQSGNTGNTRVRNDLFTGTKEGNNIFELTPDVALNSPPETGFLFTGSLGTFAADTTYTLTVGLGADPQDRTTFIGLATGTTLPSLAGQTSVNSLTLSNTALVDFTFVLDTAVTTGVVGQDIRVFLGQTTTANSQFSRSSFFDNVRLDGTANAVPEPSSMILLDLAAAGLLVRRCRV